MEGFRVLGVRDNLVQKALSVANITVVAGISKFVTHKLRYPSNARMLGTLGSFPAPKHFKSAYGYMRSRTPKTIFSDTEDVETGRVEQNLAI